jgi:FMN phosphatase YigB (HAD superfamily)
MVNIEFIYFDLGKVILEFDHELACQQIATVADVAVEEVRRVLFQSDLQLRYETGLITSEQFHQQFCVATGSSPDKDALLLAGSDIFALNPPMLPLIKGLAAGKIPIGILSNTCKAHWEFIENRFPFVCESFSHSILSYQVKAIKPDEQIYREAIKTAGVAPEKIFFMDDRVENVSGAIAAGMDAVVFQSETELAAQLRDRGIEY